MSDTKLDPASLTAEERAIVEDAVSHHAFFDADGNIVECDEWTWCYRSAIARILARRALFAPPASEEKVTCPNCLQKVPSELEHYHSGYHDDNYTVEPHYVCEQQISELDDRHNRMVSPEYQAKVKAEMARRAVEIGVDRLVGVATSPVSETVTVGAWQLEELLKYADYAEVALRTGFHPPDFIFEPADRSLRQCIDAIKEQRDKWRSQPAPAVAMTPELRHVLEAARESAYVDENEFPDKPWAEQTRAAITAVIAQASQPQRVAEDSDRTTYLEELAREESMYCAVLPKVREALIALSGCVNDRVNMDKVIAALAELDAVEGVKG